MWVLLGKFANQNSVLTEWTWVALWLVIFSCFLLKKFSLKKNYKYLFHWLILNFNITNFRLWPLVSHQGCMHPWGRNAFLSRDLLLIRFYLHLHQTASFVQWKGRYITYFSLCSNNQKFYFVGMLSMTCSPPFFFK